MVNALETREGERMRVHKSAANAERMLRWLAKHHGLLAWMLEDLVDELHAGVDVSDLAPLLRSAGAEYAAVVLESLKVTQEPGTSEAHRS